MTLLKPMFQWFSPGGKSAQLSVLILHQVLAEQDPLFPDEMHARRFDELCGWLKNWFNVLPLDQAVARLASETLPPRAACITFDDGYSDNFHVALPILKRHGLTATFFIATGFLDGGRMWNDTLINSIRTCAAPELDLTSLGLGKYALDSFDYRRAAIAALINQIKYKPVEARIALVGQLAVLAEAKLPDDLMMTSQEVKAMHHAGMQIGAHTVSHPILARLTDTQARQEILESKIFLEQLLGEGVDLFAYPNGKPGEDYKSQTVDLVRDLGFEAAVSTEWGTTGAGGDHFQIKRFTPWDKTRLRFGVRMLANLRNT